MEGNGQVADRGASADGSGTDHVQPLMAEGCSSSPSDAVGPASIEQRDPDVVELEIKAAQGVGAVAQAWADLLPTCSPWQALYAELATSLADDEGRLSLVGSGGSGGCP